MTEHKCVIYIEEMLKSKMQQSMQVKFKGSMTIWPVEKKHLEQHETQNNKT